MLPPGLHHHTRRTPYHGSDSPLTPALWRTAAGPCLPSSQASPQTRPDYRIHHMPTGNAFRAVKSMQDTKRARRFEIRGVVVITPPCKTALRTRTSRQALRCAALAVSDGAASRISLSTRRPSTPPAPSPSHSPGHVLIEHFSGLINSTSPTSPADVERWL